eukprot:SAG31_NODE_4539_length_3154_cov_17.499836_1_plen_170_part_00
MAEPAGKWAAETTARLSRTRRLAARSARPKGQDSLNWSLGPRTGKCTWRKRRALREQYHQTLTVRQLPGRACKAALAAGGSARGLQPSGGGGRRSGQPLPRAVPKAPAQPRRWTSLAARLEQGSSDRARVRRRGWKASVVGGARCCSSALPGNLCAAAAGRCRAARAAA